MTYLHEWLCRFIPEWAVNVILSVFFGTLYLSGALGLIYGIVIILKYAPAA